MANIYVRSTDGVNTDNGSTWALAKLDLAGADGIDVAGDTIYVSDNHAESTAASVTLSFAGTVASPTRIICGDDAAEPPTAVATTGTMTTTGTSSITISGNVYVYGMTFSCGTGIGIPLLTLGVSNTVRQVYENCKLRMIASATTSRITTTETNANGGSLEFINTTVRFANASQAFRLTAARFNWKGGGIESGGTAINNLIVGAATNLGRSSSGVIENCDFSAGAAGMNLTSGISSGSGLIFRNCRLPASWTGSPAASMSVGSRVEMHNCDNADTNYRLWVEDYYGSVKSETTIVRTGGANDGTTTLSWRMATGADAEYPHGLLYSNDIAIWNDTTGSSITATVEIIHDSQGAGTGARFQDDEIWLEVNHLGTSGLPQGVRVTDSKADVLATAADQTDSSETWTTTGLTTPVKQKLSVTFTPQEKGYVIARVVMARASKVAYIDPKITIT